MCDAGVFITWPQITIACFGRSTLPYDVISICFIEEFILPIFPLKGGQPLINFRLFREGRALKSLVSFVGGGKEVKLVAVINIIIFCARKQPQSSS